MLSIYYNEEQTLTSYQPERVRAHTHMYQLVLRTLKNKCWVKLQLKIWKSQRTGESTIKTVLNFFQRMVLWFWNIYRNETSTSFKIQRTTQNLVFNMVPVMLLPFCNNFSQESVATGQLSITTRKMKKISFSLWKIHIPSINRLDAGKPTPTLWHVIVVIELTAHNMLSRSCWYQMLVVISCNNVV